MKLPFIPTKSTFKDKPLLALDIGTEFVKALVFKLDQGSIRIISASKIRQQGDAMKGGAITNIESVVESCKVAIEEVSKVLNRREKLTDCVLGIAGEFVKGMSVLAHYDRESPGEKINDSEIKQVMQNIKAEAFAQAAKELADEIGIDESQIQLVNANITDTYIDKFRVTSPLGFQGKSVQFNVFTSFAPAIHFNALRHIAEQAGLNVLAIVAEPFVVSQAHKDANTQNFGGIFIDMGGGTTDIAVVRRGGVVDTEMFAFGGRVFTKRISADLNVDYKQAEDLKLRYSSGKLSEEAALRVKKAIRKDVDVWINGVELALSEIEDIEIFPSSIYLCGGGSLLPEIKQAILEYPWTQVLPFNHFPRVSYLLVENCRNIIDETESLTEPADVTPAALARFALEIIRDDKG